MTRMYAGIRDDLDTPAFTQEVVKSIESAAARVSRVSEDAKKAQQAADVYFQQVAARG